MKNMFKRSMPVVTVVVLVALGYVALSAQSGGYHPTNSNAGGRSLDEPKVAVLTGRSLNKTAISYDNPSFGVALVAGPQGLDGVTTVNCPGTTGTCTIGAEMSVQLGFGNNSPGFSLCFAVDGSIVNVGGCPDLGTIPANNWSFASFSEATSVPHGTHTVQTIIWPYDTADRGYYTINYRVYKP
jgi:hypothetical protein